MVWLAQKYRLEFEAAPGLLVEPRVLDSDGGLVGKGNHELHLLRAKQVAMAAIDTDTPENFLLDLQGDAEHRMDLRGDKGIIMDKTVLVGVEAVDGHAWPARLDGTTGAALTNADLHATHQAAVKAVMRQNVQPLLIRIKLKDAGALGPREVHSLRRDDLEHFVQIKRGRDNGGDAVNGGKLVDFAPQLFIGLLIEAAVLNVDRDDAGHDLYEAHLIAGKVARLAGLDADNADEALAIAKENDGQRQQPMIVTRVGAGLRGEVLIGQRILAQQRTPLVGNPAAVSLAKAQGEVHATQRAGTVGSAQGQDALQFVVKKDGAEIDAQFFGDDLGGDL